MSDELRQIDSVVHHMRIDRLEAPVSEVEVKRRLTNAGFDLSKKIERQEYNYHIVWVQWPPPPTLV
jgi:hypothetical protein